MAETSDKIFITKQLLDDLEVAIAEKAGLSGQLTINEMITAVKNFNTTPLDTYTDAINTTVDGYTMVYTSDEMSALITEDNVGNLYRYMGTTDDAYVYGDFYEVVEI